MDFGLCGRVKWRRAERAECFWGSLVVGLGGVGRANVEELGGVGMRGILG